MTTARLLCFRDPATLRLCYSVALRRCNLSVRRVRRDCLGATTACDARPDTRHQIPDTSDGKVRSWMVPAGVSEWASGWMELGLGHGL